MTTQTVEVPRELLEELRDYMGAQESDGKGDVLWHRLSDALLTAPALKNQSENFNSTERMKEPTTKSPAVSSSLVDPLCARDGLETPAPKRREFQSADGSKWRKHILGDMTAIDYSAASPARKWISKTCAEHLGERASEHT